MVIRDFPRFFPPKVLLSRLPLQRGGPLAAKQRLRFRREERCDITRIHGHCDYRVGPNLQQLYWAITLGEVPAYMVSPCMWSIFSGQNRGRYTGTKCMYTLVHLV